MVAFVSGLPADIPVNDLGLPEGPVMRSSDRICACDTPPPTKEMLGKK